MNHFMVRRDRPSGAPTGPNRYLEAMERTFTGVFKKVGDWYIAYVEELPGANTQGRTIQEARENLREAIALVLAANRELTAYFK